MQLKTWLLVVRVINILAALMMLGFEAWFIIDLLRSNVEIIVLIIRMFTPAFVMYYWPCEVCSPSSSSPLSSSSAK